MLVSFSVSNFRSFDEEVTLNMVASNKLTDHLHHRIPIADTGQNLVRSAVLYGANGSGKSNLIKAMAFAQRMISGQQSDRLSGADVFRFRRSSISEPSSFEFRFLLDQKVFAYGFDLVKYQISSEWLTLVKGDDDSVIFERDAEGAVVVGPAARKGLGDDRMLASTLDVLAKLSIRPHQLFLNLLSSFPDATIGATLTSIIQWLTRDLSILDSAPRACDIYDRLDQDALFRGFAEQFLNRVDTGIGKLTFEKTRRESRDQRRDVYKVAEDSFEYMYSDAGFSGDTDEIPDPDDPTKVIVRRLLANHDVAGKSFSLPFSEESHGAQQLLNYLPILSAASGRGTVIVIDEFDRNLHPLLCEEFIRFFSEHPQCVGTQLIVTTHEVQLLSQDLLRRDEYWFMEKDRTQQSRLVSLSDFNVRNDLQVRKGYLQGRFGAIPVIGNTDELDRLTSYQTGVNNDATQETIP